MLKQETLKNGLIRTYSDENKYIIQNETGIMYIEAVDIPNRYTYTESDIPIEMPQEDRKPPYPVQV